MVRYNNERQIEMCFKCVPIWQQHLSCFISLHSLQILYIISLNSLWMLLRGKNKKAIQNVKHSLMCVFPSLQPIQLRVSQLFFFLLVFPLICTYMISFYLKVTVLKKQIQSCYMTALKYTIPKFGKVVLNHKIKKMYRLKSIYPHTEMFDILDDIKF